MTFINIYIKVVKELLNFKKMIPDYHFMICFIMKITALFYIQGRGINGKLISITKTGTNSSQLLHKLFEDYESAISPHADMGR